MPHLTLPKKSDQGKVRKEKDSHCWRKKLEFWGVLEPLLRHEKRNIIFFTELISANKL
jgi:hypothetical protein